MVATVGDEHVVAINNREFFLRADNVVVNSRFIFYDKKYEGNINWKENNSKDNKVSINARKYKILHAATTNNDNFVIHMTRGDETFPIPTGNDPYYVFPLYISGSMSFLGRTIKRVKFSAYEEVMITQDKKVQLRQRK